MVEVVQQLKNLTSTETLNGGDTKVALEILYKITFNDSLLPKNTSYSYRVLSLEKVVDFLSHSNKSSEQ